MLIVYGCFDCYYLMFVVGMECFVSVVLDNSVVIVLILLCVFLFD